MIVSKPTLLEGLRVPSQQLVSVMFRPFNVRVTKLCEGIIALVNAHRTYLLLSLIISVAVYGSFLFVPGFHIDDELSAVYGFVDVGFSLGRWGISLIRLTFIPGPFNAYFTTLFSLLGLSAMAVLFTSILDLSGFERAAAICLYVAFPQFCYQLQFHLQADVIPIGYILAVASFLLTLSARKYEGGSRIGCGIGSVFLMMLSLSIYQPNADIFLALCLLHALRRVSRGESLGESVRFAAACLLLLMTACALYLLVSRFFIHVTGIPNGGSYFTDQFAWTKHPLTQTMWHVLSMLEGAFGGKSYYGEGLYVSVALPVLAILYSSFRLGMARAAASAALLLVTLICPYALVILLGSPQAGRTFVSQPLVFSGIWAIALGLLAARMQAATYRVVASSFLVVMLLSGTFFSSRLAFSDYIQWKADVSFGTRIVDSVYRKYTDFDPKLKFVYFYGNHAHPEFWRKPNYDLFGASFFSWGIDSTDRIDTFLYSNGIADFHAPPENKREPLKLAVRKLPCWPNPESILLVGDALVVHLSD